jgi:protein CpxP
MTRQKVLISVAGTIALAAAVAIAGPAAAWRHGPPPDGGLQRQLDKLNLDSTQQQQVQAVLDAAKQQRSQFRTQLETARDQMHELMTQDPPDEAKIMAQADALGQLQNQAHKAMLHTMLQVRAVLTPEQRTQLEDLMPPGPGPHHHGCQGDDGGDS